MDLSSGTTLASCFGLINHLSFLSLSQQTCMKSEKPVLIEYTNKKTCHSCHILEQVITKRYKEYTCFCCKEDSISHEIYYTCKICINMNWCQKCHDLPLDESNYTDLPHFFSLNDW